MKHGIPLLLVEDDEVDVMTVLRAFRKNNITNPVHTVGNGEEALSYLRGQPPYHDAEKHPRPGLILLDINMPIMNGVEFLKVMKSDPDLRTIPVIVLTTSREEQDRFNSFNLGVAGYIIKPVDFEKFVEAVGIINAYWTLTELPGGGLS